LQAVHVRIGSGVQSDVTRVVYFAGDASARRQAEIAVVAADVTKAAPPCAIDRGEIETFRFEKATLFGTSEHVLADA